MQAHVRHSAHRTDGGAARGQGVLVAGLGEDVAEATTRVGPADLGYSRMRLAVGRRAGTVGRARVVGAGVGIGAQVGAAHAGDEWVAGRPLNCGERDERLSLDGALHRVGRATVAGRAKYCDGVTRSRDISVAQIEQRLEAGASGGLRDAVELGRRVAGELIGQGAADLIAESRVG